MGVHVPGPTGAITLEVAREPVVRVGKIFRGREVRRQHRELLVNPAIQDPRAVDLPVSARDLGVVRKKVDHVVGPVAAKKVPQPPAQQDR